MSQEKRNLEAIIKVGNFILSHGPVVKTQEAGNLYIQHKGLVTKKPSMEHYELFCQIFEFSTAVHV